MDNTPTSQPSFALPTGFTSLGNTAPVGLGELKPQSALFPSELPQLSSPPIQNQHPLSQPDLTDNSVIPAPANWQKPDSKQFSHSSRRAKKAGEPDPITGLTEGRSLVNDDRTSSTLRTAGLPYPGRLLRYVPGAPLRFDNAAKQWQIRMRERGWSIQADGFYGAQSARICRQFQQEKGLQADGVVGPATWAAAFRSDNLATPRPSPGSTTRINARGLELVKKFEGLVLTAYRDPVGIWTIGYGHTGPEVGPGDVITRAQAEALLRKDLTRFESAVRSLVKVPLSSNQFSALVSFTYNVGSGALASSTLLSLLNQRNYQGAADQFPRWVNGGGQVLPGLVRRRNEERALFLTPG